jgi:hypothetical protein
MSLDSREVCVRGVQKHIPFAANSCRRHEQGYCSAGANPFVSETMERLVSGAVPGWGKEFWIQPVRRKLLRNFCLDGHEINRPKIRLQIDKCLYGSEGKRSRRVNYWHSPAVPTATVEAGALPPIGIGSIALTAYPPDPHQLYTP